MIINENFRRREPALNWKKNPLSPGANRLSSTLITTSAVGALMLSVSGPAEAQVITPGDPACPFVGTVVTCSGDLQNGIDVDDPYDTLNVLNVDPPGITPDPGDPGIDFEGSAAGGITVNADTTGTNGIVTTGTNGDGISAVHTGSGDVSITSTGNIATDGASANAITGEVTINGNVTIESKGNITSEDSSSEGIYGEVGNDGNIVITNTGNISTTGNNSQAIEGRIGGDGNIKITSTGNLTTAHPGSSADGIQANLRNGSGDIVITSTGDITTAGTPADGIFAYLGQDGNITITSRGNIMTSGSSADGIYLLLNGTGTITTNTSGSVSGISGIVVTERTTNDAPATINNSAAITGTGGISINLRGESNDVVNLMPGSSISGAMDFGDNDVNDVDSLNFLAGVNDVIMFADAGGTGQGDSDPESAPENINFAGSGIVSADGLTAVGVDVSGFAAQNTMIHNLINGVFNSLDNQPTYGSGLGEALGYAHDAETRAVDPDRFRFWKSAFGGYSETEAQGNVIDFEERFIGHVSGAEKGDADNGGVFGVLGGFGRSKVELDFDAGETETDAFFGGLYFKRNAAYARINATFLGGFTQSESERLVGMDIAKGDFDGVFIAPAVTLAASIGSAALPFEIATRISALHWRLDDYTETGSGAPLTVDDRHITQVNLRGHIALPVDLVHDDGSYTQFTARLGVDGTIDAGSDDVQASALGVPFSFDATLDDDVKGFAGLAVRHTSAGGKFALGVSGELQSNTDGDWAASGEVSGAFKL